MIVGTHKLLMPDVKFKNLGLVMVDEEQRFGVRQKEQLKKLRAEVDLLTMTATPIPRTLNMAMSGLRDLSLIATPPAHRTAVRTFISAWDPATIREALQRELARGGQVYFLHNEVESIERIVREARRTGARGAHPHRPRPDARARAGKRDGGLPPPALQRAGMHHDHRNRHRHPHRQHHHHRPRRSLRPGPVAPVARPRRPLAPSRVCLPRGARSQSITADAQKRLEALASLEELGAGFTLATHDLEIRGAGELLGDEQSGQIQSIGFGLYTELLDRAVRALKSGKVPDFDLSSERETEVELHLPALIPDDYLGDVHTRLTLYKRIASAPRSMPNCAICKWK